MDGRDPTLERIRDAALAARSAGLTADAIVDLARQIDDRAAANVAAAPAEHVPEVVFERLLGLLAERVADADPDLLVARLEQLPADSFTRDTLLAAAKRHALDSLASVPDDQLTPALLLRRARYRAAHAHWDEALEDALRAGPETDHDAAVLAVRSLVALRRAADALDLLGRLLDRFPDDPYFRSERAELYSAFHYDDLAWEDARRLLVSDDPRARLAGARIAVATGHDAEAAAAARDGRLSVERLVVLARAERSLGRPGAAAAAARAYVDATARDDTLATHHRRLEALVLAADALAALGRYDEARGCCLDAWALGGGGYELRRAYTFAAERPWERDPTERALLRAVVDSSGAPDAVAAFAAHLAAQGDPRAALFTTPAPSADAVAHAVGRWIEPSMHARMHGGFPAHVRLLEPDQIPLIERLPWVEVVQELIVLETERGRGEGFGALFRQELPALRALEIRSGAFGYEATVALTRCPAYRRLQSLRLIQCDLDAPAIARIVETLPPTVRELRLAYADGRPRLPLRPTVGDAFRRSVGLAELELLDVTDCALGPDDVPAILGAEMPRLRHLILRGNDLSGIDPDRLPDLAVTRRLHTLVLGETGAEARIVRALLDRLDELSLRAVVAPGDWSGEEAGLVTEHPNRARIELSFGDASDSEQHWLERLGLVDGASES